MQLPSLPKSFKVPRLVSSEVSAWACSGALTTMATWGQMEKIVKMKIWTRARRHRRLATIWKRRSQEEEVFHGYVDVQVNLWGRGIFFSSDIFRRSDHSF